MNNKTILYWTAQFVGWSLFYSVIGINLYFSNRLNNKSVGLLIAIYAGSIFFSHLLRNFFVAKEYVNLKIQQIIPRALLLSVLLAAVIKLFQVFLDRFIIHYNEGPIELEAFIIDLIGLTFPTFLWTVFYFAYQFFDKSRREEIKNLQWQALQNQIELNNLKSQLNPHFMFNSLNSIRALIDINKKDAKTSITKLSTLLRTSLLMGKKNVVSIAEELELVKNYLDLEKVRFEERLQVELDIDPKTTEVEIPPLMLQTLVENAIKHGISKRMDGGIIVIRTRIENRSCIIEIQNPGSLNKAEDENGSIGLKNTRDRLRLMFGKKSQFKLQQSGENVVATIIIKTE